MTARGVLGEIAHMGKRLVAVAAFGSIFLPPVSAASAETDHHSHMDMPKAVCAQTTLDCANAASPAFDSKGRLWLAWIAGGRVSVARSTDMGTTFGEPVIVSPPIDRQDNGPDARPQVVIAPGGRMVVAYDQFKDDKWNAQIWVSQSDNDGAHFSAPVSMTDNPYSQRFPALSLGADGSLFAAWIDKRTVTAQRAQGINAPGGAIAYAWSTDGGVHFGPSQLVADNTCECCRIGIARNGKGFPVLSFRNLYDGGVRDHSVVTFTAKDTPGTPQRVAEDQWQTNACPHHGPSLDISSQGTIHTAWFTQGSARKGVFHARSIDGGQTFSTPIALGTPERHASRPYVLATPKRVWIAWKEFDGHQTTVMVKSSDDDGASWSEPKSIAATADTSDHPILIAKDGHAYLSWLRKVEGYHLFDLDSSP